MGQSQSSPDEEKSRINAAEGQKEQTQPAAPSTAEQDDAVEEHSWSRTSKSNTSIKRSARQDASSTATYPESIAATATATPTPRGRPVGKRSKPERQPTRSSQRIAQAAGSTPRVAALASLHDNNAADVFSTPLQSPPSSSMTPALTATEALSTPAAPAGYAQTLPLRSSPTAERKTEAVSSTVRSIESLAKQWRSESRDKQAQALILLQAQSAENPESAALLERLLSDKPLDERMQRDWDGFVAKHTRMTLESVDGAKEESVDKSTQAEAHDRDIKAETKLNNAASTPAEASADDDMILVSHTISPSQFVDIDADPVRLRAAAREADSHGPKHKSASKTKKHIVIKTDPIVLIDAPEQPKTATVSKTKKVSKRKLEDDESTVATTTVEIASQPIVDTKAPASKKARRQPQTATDPIPLFAKPPVLEVQGNDTTPAIDFGDLSGLSAQVQRQLKAQRRERKQERQQKLGGTKEGRVGKKGRRGTRGKGGQRRRQGKEKYGAAAATPAQL